MSRLSSEDPLSRFGVEMIRIAPQGLGGYSQAVKYELQFRTDHTGIMEAPLRCCFSRFGRLS